MFLFVSEAKYRGYAQVGVENYAYCTCGAKFVLKDVDEQGNELSHCEVCCPKCGARFGNRQTLYLRSSDGKVNLVAYCKDKNPMHEVLVEGDLVKLVKEAPKGDLADYVIDGNPIEVIRYVLTFDTAHGLRPVKLEVDGREVNLTVTNIGKACSGLSATSICIPEEAKRFKDEITWIQIAMGHTSSLAEAAKGLLKYPVLDSLYEEKERQQWTHAASGFWAALENDYLQAGERSLKKAFPLPRQALDLVFRGKVRFGHTYKVVEKLGDNLGAEMLKLAAEILKDSPNDVHELALFLAGRNTVERQRLKIYLTEEVCIYQGIEDPKAAWHLLRDYINMSEDMNVPYNLCPKSLKLRHDLAARNHRLVLEEIERKKFKEKAAAENYARLEWTSKDGKWAVLVPKDAGDLVREGSELSHCVGSYAKYVIDGSMRICFLRKTENLDKPLLTLSVNASDCCTTYLGFDNRDAVAEEVFALREWTKARGLTLWEN